MFSAGQFVRLPAAARALAARRPNAVLLETARFDEENHRSWLFLDPQETIAVHTLEELPALFDRVEAALARGLYVAGFLGYECGAYFVPHQVARSPQPMSPLAWFGVYREPVVFDHATGEFAGAQPVFDDAEELAPEPVIASEDIRLEIDEPQYVAAVERIKQYIAAGDTYQVNLTDAVALRVPQSPAAAFAALLESQPVSYAAWLHLEEASILSLSPELFLRVQNRGGARRIVTRPMKGTMPRGLDGAEDAARAAELAADEKNRSEHVMIVDLLRNDLGRICRMGSVAVEDLFTVERYRTLLQMTSTVAGTLREGVGWQEIFGALFPSGSITGAPKVRTMQIIDELERGPRGVYTGAIGFLAPNGEAQFNVAIRTLVMQQDGTARMGVGGGIVADSDPAAEYRECQLKASFLAAQRPEFQLIETMLVEERTVQRLPLHLDRLKASAAYFDFVCDRARVEQSIAGYVSSLPAARLRLRLLLARDGGVALSHAALPESPAEVRVCLSPYRVVAGDLFLRHKTTRRVLYNAELARAQAEGYDETLFLNQRGELAEGAISTIFVRQDGRLLTPPLASGVLPGVLRRSLLDGGEAVERVLTLGDLASAEAVFLGNSVRGLRRVIAFAGGNFVQAAETEMPIHVASQ